MLFLNQHADKTLALSWIGAQVEIMDHKIREMIKDIINGKDLEINLPSYANKLMDSYYDFSMIRLSMDYYTYHEVLMDNPNLKEDDRKINIEINQSIKELFVLQPNQVIIEDLIKRLDCLRQETIKKMKVLTAYADIFQIYEHVLNRVEYKFIDNKEVVVEEAFINEIIQYLFDTKDNMIINDKIKEIIGQLPVRMTKSKYYELISDSISIYKGADKSSLDNYIYMLRTCSMLYHPDGMEEYFPQLNILLQDFKQVNYKELDKDGYTYYANKLQDAVAIIQLSSDYYVRIQELTNNLYTVALSYSYITKNNSRVDSICKDIIIDVYENFLEEKTTDQLDITAEKFILLEGSQEECFEEYSTLESVLYEIKTNHSNIIKSLMLDQVFNRLNLSSMLLSSSVFIELDDINLDQKVDIIYIKQVTKELLEDYSQLFSNNEQAVNRAVMSSTLNKMPVFFNTSDAVVEYITEALSQCREPTEKMASIEIIRMLMEIG